MSQSDRKVVEKITIECRKAKKEMHRKEKPRVKVLRFQGRVFIDPESTIGNETGQLNRWQTCWNIQFFYVVLCVVIVLRMSALFALFVTVVCVAWEMHKRSC